MTVYGDLETSTLTELPAGRSAIATHVVPAADKPHFLERAWERVREEVNGGRQAYVVCPRIGDGPETDDDGDYPSEDDFGSVDMTGGIPRGIGEAGRRQPLAVLDVAATLDAGPLAGLRLGILQAKADTLKQKPTASSPTASSASVPFGPDAIAVPTRSSRVDRAMVNAKAIP